MADTSKEDQSNIEFIIITFILGVIFGFILTIIKIIGNGNIIGILLGVIIFAYIAVYGPDEKFMANKTILNIFRIIFLIIGAIFGGFFESNYIAIGTSLGLIEKIIINILFITICVMFFYNVFRIFNILTSIMKSITNGANIELFFYMSTKIKYHVAFIILMFILIVVCSQTVTIFSHNSLNMMSTSPHFPLNIFYLISGTAICLIFCDIGIIFLLFFTPHSYNSGGTKYVINPWMGPVVGLCMIGFGLYVMCLTLGGFINSF